MLFGSATIQLDEKNRMRIPAKYRQEFGKSFYICHGSDDCLFVMSKEGFEKFTAPLMEIRQSDIEGQNAKRSILGTAEIPEEDSQGRFVLPLNLKAIASIDKKVVFVGVGDKLEVWAEEKMQDMDICKTGSINRAYEKMKRYDF